MATSTPPGQPVGPYGEHAALSYAAVSVILFHKHGWRMSRQRVEQVGKRAERKLRTLLARLEIETFS